MSDRISYEDILEDMTNKNESGGLLEMFTLILWVGLILLITVIAGGYSGIFGALLFGVITFFLGYPVSKAIIYIFYFIGSAPRVWLYMLFHSGENYITREERRIKEFIENKEYFEKREKQQE